MLQNKLLALVETQLGPRDSARRIYQPTFDVHGPYLMNTSNLDGAFVVLSPNAAGYWPTTVYEMAHETVHLLDPIVGPTNWLEEGVAVAFAIHAMASFNLPAPVVSLASYREALALVEALPSGPFATARSARTSAGALSAVTFEQLVELAPGHDESRLRQLASRCVPR